MINTKTGPKKVRKYWTPSDYTPWTNWAPGDKFGDLASLVKAPKNKKQFATPPCVFADPYIEYMNDEEVKK